MSSWYNIGRPGNRLKGLLHCDTMDIENWQGTKHTLGKSTGLLISQNISYHFKIMTVDLIYDRNNFNIHYDVIK